jgi:UDP-N-acetylglucosamine 1-carboxyvinyltransferase
MEKFVIKGRKKLGGEIRVKGAKNAALKILVAALLTDEKCSVSNIPQIEDVFNLIKLLQEAGAEIEHPKNGSCNIKTPEIKDNHLNEGVASRLKSSILLAAPLLARTGEVFLPKPGGCVIGQRPRDIFLDSFESFGAKITSYKKGYRVTASKLKGSKFVFPIVSVTATETAVLMGVLAEGKTELVNAACEPEVVNLVGFLKKMGAKIKGEGTPFIEIEGVKKLHGASVRVIPDRLEAGTFSILGAVANAPLKVTGVNPSHLEVVWSLLKKAGVNLEVDKDFVEVKPSLNLKAVNLRTHEYPGFPTDLQPPFTLLMTQAKGLSLVHETIFEGRLFYTDTLNQMGSQIVMCDPHRVLVHGSTKLVGRKLISPDIRAGIALVMAALIAQGESVIENIQQVDRGYEKIEERLQKIGAEIKRVNC